MQSNHVKEKTKFVEEKLTMLTSDIESKLAIVKSKPTYRGSPEKKIELRQIIFAQFSSRGQLLGSHIRVPWQVGRPET